jgi:hypothetical protein
MGCQYESLLYGFRCDKRCTNLKYGKQLSGGHRNVEMWFVNNITVFWDKTPCGVIDWYEHHTEEDINLIIHPVPLEQTADEDIWTQNEIRSATEEKTRYWRTS